MRLAAAIAVVLACGCSGSTPLQSNILGQLQEKHGNDKITVVKWYKEISDSDCDLSADHDLAAHLRKLAPFKATRIQFRVANKKGEQELQDKFVVIGKNEGWITNVSAFEAGDPVYQIIEKL
ncbi:MAG: hypothetical protein JSS49_05285 [Planctomycetes bacterium]|nr:hypothetical protein [Planctomycetota bacterium]